jgi:hypothetical protein
MFATLVGRSLPAAVAAPIVAVPSTQHVRYLAVGGPRKFFVGNY